MKYILVLSLILSFTNTPAMYRYNSHAARAIACGIQRRQAAPSMHPIHRVMRSCNIESEPTNDHREVDKEIKKLRRYKTALLYSRPIVTVAGIASINQLSAHFGLAQPEVITLLMASATLNAVVYHKVDEWYQKRIEDAEKKLKGRD